MSPSPFNTANLSLSVQQIKAQTLQSLISFDTSSDAGNLFSNVPSTSELFDKLFAAAKNTASETSNVPSGLDTLQPFSRPGQNVVTVINRVDVSFKAQFSALSELKSTLALEQESAQKLAAIDEHTSNAEFKSKLMDFVATYNSGVHHIASDLAQGGVLEGSQEARRAQFATQRDIANPLIGADGGLRGGMSALGVAIDPHTGLASINETQLDAVLARDTDADVRTIVDFARTFSQTTTSLNSKGNQQDNQMNNLDRAIHWIADNRVEVQKEFGPGLLARPNAAFAKAAAAYALIAQQ